MTPCVSQTIRLVATAVLPKRSGVSGYASLYQNGSWKSRRETTHRRRKIQVQFAGLKRAALRWTMLNGWKQQLLNCDRLSCFNLMRYKN